MVYNITLLHSLIYPFDPVKNHALGTEVVIMITLCCTSQYYVAVVSYGQLLHLFMMSVRNPQILGSLHSSIINRCRSCESTSPTIYKKGLFWICFDTLTSIRAFPCHWLLVTPTVTGTCGDVHILSLSFKAYRRLHMEN